jgi:peptidyl-prolyl cis-trans isomerase D
MMTKIREKTHILLYLLVIAFVALIVIEWGANYSDIARTKRGIIGKIDGDNVRYADFQTVYFNQTQQTQQQKGGEALSESELEGISDQVWNQMVEERLLQRFIRKNGITVGDSEIVYHLKYNPPDFLRQSPSFQTDGKFDMNKYFQALSNPQYGKQWAEIESILRMQLPFSKIQSVINTTARVSESELRVEYMRRNLKLSAKLIYISPAEVASETVTAADDELKAYYNSHRDDFKEPEKARLAYVNFSDQTTKEDSAEVFDRLAEIRKQIAEGKDFGELAKQYSIDKGTAENGGSLGWFAKGAMVKEFEDACFSGKAGEVVGPIQTQFGYHLIKIEDTKFVSAKKSKKKKTENQPQDSVKASHILIRMEASNKTIESARENANAFYETAKAEGFDKAFEKYTGRFSLRIDTTAEFLNNDRSMVPGFPDRLRGVLRYAFSQDREPLTRPYHTGSGFTIFTSVGYSKAGIKKYEEVSDKVKLSVIDEKRKELVYKKASGIREKMKTIDDIKKIDTSIIIRDVNNFSLNGSIPGVGRDVRASGAMFSIPVGTLSEAIKGTRGVYIVQVVQRDEFNESKYQTARADLKRQLLNIKQQKVYKDWFEATKKITPVEDFRADFNL